MIERFSSQALYGRGDLPLLKISNASMQAVLSLHGAQLLSFCPNTGQDLLWLSPLASLQAGEAIRGGIPICAPWFGVNQSQPDWPKHGFLRLRQWQLLEEQLVEQSGGSDEHETSLVLEYRSQAEDRPWCAQEFVARIRFVLGESLSMEFSLQNLGDATMPLSWAFHSYLAVSDSEAVRVPALADKPFLDATDSFALKHESSPLAFVDEVDRVYCTVGGVQELLDTARSVRISAENAPTAVCWNPGELLGSKMADVGPHYRDYVCIERGAAFEDALSLAPQQTLQASMRLRPLGAGDSLER